MDKRLLDLADRQGGFLRESDLIGAGMTKADIRSLVAKEEAVLWEPGFYAVGKKFPDGRFLVTLKYPEAVFSESDCLDLLGVSNWTPDRYCVYMPKAGTPHKARMLKIRHVDGLWYSLGIVKRKSPFGNFLPTYSLERVIVDLASGRNDFLDAEQLEWLLHRLVTVAVDWEKAIRYGRRLGVDEGRVRDFLGRIG